MDVSFLLCCYYRQPSCWYLILFVNMKSRWILLLLLIFKGFVSASPRGSSQIRRREPSIPLVTPFLASSESNAHDELRKRQITTQISTCGYHDGDPTKPRSAAPGFDCRVDTKNGLWGFCPTTVILASDCGLAGFCVDGSNCSGGCGILGVSTITTFTWSVCSFFSGRCFHRLWL